MTRFPHWIMAEPERPQTIDALIYIPRDKDQYQFVTDYEVWISPDRDETNLQKVAEGTWARADAVLAYTGSLTGAEWYQYDKTLYDALHTENEVLKLLLNTIDSKVILAQVKKVEGDILGLLGSNRTPGEELITDIPKTMMRAAANSANSGYAPEKAIDGNPGTIWHSEWSPENDPFPHILTIDLQKKMLLNDITIWPRQDMDTGKITKGQIYAGDSPENMKHITDFTGASGKDGTVINLNFEAARYIQIYSLEATSKNTAISEVSVSTFDRGITGAFRIYDRAMDLLRKAVVGTDIGQYLSKDIDAFRKSVEEFGGALNKDPLSIQEYYEISKQISDAYEAFRFKAKAYSKSDLSALINRLKNLINKMESAGDKTSAQAVLESGNTLWNNPNATREELHNMCNKLMDFMKSIDMKDNNLCDLSGEWALALEGYGGSGMNLPEKVTLPGTLDTNKTGIYNPLGDINKLSRYYIYTGPATYQKDVYISKEWAGKSMMLYMERSRETRVWVNGIEVKSPDTSNVLPVSQRYEISKYLNFGEYNTITIVVDNSYPNLPSVPVIGSHMATDETQTNWNGILGTFALEINESVFIEDLRVYPNSDLKSVTVKVDVKNTTDSDYTGALVLSCAGSAQRAINLGLAAEESKTFTIFDYAMPADVKLWSEFDRPLYEMTALLEGRSIKQQFGMRVFRKGTDNKSFTINGKKVFLRSEANCAVFPMTGHAPMDEAGWEKLFSTYQSYGINAVRFHSWCPPEAAFRVADRLGLYLQPELSCWDPAMFGDNTKKTYYTKEAFAILKEYASHPSFVMFSFGNELQYQETNYQYADQLIQNLKKADSTRLYAPGSNVSFSSANPTANTDFYTAQAFWGTPLRGIYGGMGGFINQEYPSSKVNYDDAAGRISAFGVPSFSFEVGQFQVFPDLLSETSRYTGVLDARNFRMISEKVGEKGITDAEVKDAINASGMLSRIGYKAEIEAALRTKDLSGISLLGIQDFSGQGTALVGMMNAFGESKPYEFADPDAFSDFFSPTVVLLETDRFSYKNTETLTGSLLLSNYSQGDMKGEIHYKLSQGDGTVVAEGNTKSTDFPQGGLTRAGDISISLNNVGTAAQLKLELSFQKAKNSYHIWVYPDENQAGNGDVYVSEYLDDIAAEVLAEGGKVFLSPKAMKSTLPQSVAGNFTTAFWSSGFTSESQPGTMGLLLNPEHPIFSGFPTEYHSDYQWWAMSRYGRPMNLEALQDEKGQKIRPIVKVIDGFANLNNMGLLYEAKVGNGKIIVSSMGLEQLKYEYPEAAALRNAIIHYMNSDNFDPAFAVEAKTIREQVLQVPGNKKNNLASKYNGGKPFTGKNTETCQGGYDRDPVDRLTEINDGIVDLDTPSRSWTDYRGDQTYAYDVEIGVELSKEYTIDSVAFAFFEDPGCKVPASIKVKYWNGEAYVDVKGQDRVSGFAPGMNTLSFNPVFTDKLLFVMEHHAGMAIAISELFVYEKQVDPDKIILRSAGDKSKIHLGETLQMRIETEPAYANNTHVRWSVLDRSGNSSDLAKISFDGVLYPIAAGTVIVKAELRSNRSITATREIRIVDDEETSSGGTSSETNSETSSPGSGSSSGSPETSSGGSSVPHTSSGISSDGSGKNEATDDSSAGTSERADKTVGTGNPKTGEAGILAAGILAILAAGAVLLTRKRDKV